MPSTKSTKKAKRRRKLSKLLKANARAAMFAAIEIHNKPIFKYRYEVCTLLMVNAWELALKSYIAKELKTVKLVKKDGTTKPFSECVACVASKLGKPFEPTKQNLTILYEYRNKVAHSYATELETVILGLLKSTVILFSEFMEHQLGEKLYEADNLILLPIGFKTPVSPLDFLSKQSAATHSSSEVKTFLESIKKSSDFLEKQGFEESIIVNYSMALVAESRIKNADLVAAINNATPQGNVIAIHNVVSAANLTNDPSAKQLRISEDTVFDNLFPLTYYEVIDAAKKRFSNFTRNRQFNDLMRELKRSPNLARVRLLNPKNPEGQHQTFYSRLIMDELAKKYRDQKS
jgi:EC042_2821-lke REase/Protein of unknown function (DUF3644)